MKPRLFLISLIATLAFSQAACFAAAEPSGEIVYPFAGSADPTLVLNPYMQESFLEYLRSSGVYPVMDQDGLPLFYYSETGSMGCDGVCETIDMNGYTLGSKMLDPSSLQMPNTLDSPVVMGSSSIDDYVDTVNSIRESLSGNPDALAEFEKQLLAEQEGILRSTYFENAYDDVWDYALDDMKRTDPAAYDSLRRDTIMRDLDGAVADLEKYLGENFDINEAYDMSSLYSAIENGQIGQGQLDEFMKNVLDRMAENENIDLNTDDLEKISDILNTQEFKDAMGDAMDKIGEDPEAFDKLNDIAKEIASRPETMETFKEAVDEMFANADWDSVSKVMDIFNKLDNKDKLMETLMEQASKHMRDMVQDGKIDEIKEMLTDPAMMEMMSKAVESFSQSFLEQAGEWAKQIPMEFAYFVAAIAAIATLIMLIKIKI